jgi:ABC-type lipoprotein release transport system permease subunit
MGMSQHQISAVVILQGLSTVIVSTVVGVGLGIICAGLAWGVFSRSVGVDWPMDVPQLGLVLIAGGALVTAFLIATVVAATPSARRAESLR